MLFEFSAVSTLSLLLVAAMLVGQRRRRSIDHEERVLFVGVGALAGQLVTELDKREQSLWRVLGVVVTLPEGQRPDIGPWLGPIGSLPEIIAATCPTRIVLSPVERCWRIADQALLDARMAGIVVENAADALEQVTGKLPIERLKPSALVLGAGFRHSDVVPRDLTQRTSRVTSAVAAAVGLLLTSPLLALVAIAIRMDSPGPAIFTQDRLGIGGRTFRLFKFRTMRTSDDQQSAWLSDNTHRITRIGRWLRRFRLDELPQLVNVLKGDMNLVGPRPQPACHGQLFLARIPHYRLRFSVRPGITGWAQIKYGYANGLEEETEKVRYDLYYIKHRSLLFDLRILIGTIGVLFDRTNHTQARHAPTRLRWSASWAAPTRGEVGR